MPTPPNSPRVSSPARAKPRESRSPARWSPRMEEMTEPARLAWFETLAADFGPETKRLDAAVAAWQAAPGPAAAAELHAAAEPLRQEDLPPHQSRSRWHRHPGRHARRAPPPPPGSSRTAAGRRRLRPPPLVVVQPRLPAPSPHRLVVARRCPREDHPLRGGPRDRRLRGSPPPARAARSPLLRLLPPADAGRSADLRRSGADPRHPRRPSIRSSPRIASRSTRRRRHRRLLFDLQHPARAQRHFLRQLPDQAGGRRARSREPEPQDLRHPVAAAGLRPLAEGRRCGPGP